MDYQTRQELNKLSKEIFGSSSKWQKFVNNGEAVPVMETVKVLDGKTEEVREEQRQLVYHGPNGGELAKFEIKRYTAETIVERMLLMRSQREQVRAMIKKLQEEEAAKKAQEAAQKEATDAVASVSGSANRI